MILVIFLELLLGCHCDRWTTATGNLRCAVVVNRCEFVDGFHRIAPFVSGCSTKCGPDFWAGETQARRPR